MRERGAVIIIVTICFLNEPIPSGGLNECNSNSIADLAEPDDLTAGEIYLDSLLVTLRNRTGTESQHELTIVFKNYFQCCTLRYHSRVDL